ncbi:transcriptional repressor NrdR [Candidatus Woesebacteria bacterium]|nr:transcriptional repressor NrdR [Candidatus Woesebacteria bacterium]
MKCPFCGDARNEVLESRVVEDGVAIRRRRSCEKCEKRFTTFERVNKSSLLVIKKDGRREAFDADKLVRGIVRAVGKRPVSLSQVVEIVNKVEREMLKKQTQEVATQVVGKAVLKRLKKIDKVAWLRFASVYLEFEDLSDFETLIEKTSLLKN